MGLLPKVLKGLDRDPEAVPLNYQSIEQFRSKTGGAISLCFMICAIIIFVIKILDLTQRNHVTVISQISKDKYNDPVNLIDGDFRLILFTHNDKTGNIKHNELLQHGINLTVRWLQFSVNHDSPYTSNDSVFQMVSCPNSHSKYAQFCMPKRNYSVLGRTDVETHKNVVEVTYERYAVRVQPCQKQVNSQCQNILTKIFYFFTFNSTIFDPSTADRSKVVTRNALVRVFQSKSSLNISEHFDTVLFFKKLRIFTNPSIFPDFQRMLFGHHQNYTQYAAENYEKTADTWFYDEEVETDEFSRVDEQTYREEDSCLLAIYLRRSIYTHTYIREYDKLDSVLGQFFGLIALLSIIMFTLYRGYNSWSFKQFRKKVRGQSYQHPTLCNYYMHLFKSLYSFCCCKKKTETESAILIEELEQKEELDYYGLSKRLAAVQGDPAKGSQRIRLMQESCEDIVILPSTSNPQKQSLLSHD